VLKDAKRITGAKIIDSKKHKGAPSNLHINRKVSIERGLRLAETVCIVIEKNTRLMTVS